MSFLISLRINCIHKAFPRLADLMSTGRIESNKNNQPYFADNRRDERQHIEHDHEDLEGLDQVHRPHQRHILCLRKFIILGTLRPSSHDSQHYDNLTISTAWSQTVQ